MILSDPVKSCWLVGTPCLLGIIEVVGRRSNPSRTNSTLLTGILIVRSYQGKVTAVEDPCWPSMHVVKQSLVKIQAGRRQASC
jgi:hypothetical protein